MKTTWLVVTERGNKLIQHYAGPKKARARQIASELLTNSRKRGEVRVIRASQVTTLSKADLRPILPRGVF
jgi:hypothetical protein